MHGNLARTWIFLIVWWRFLGWDFDTLCGMNKFVSIQSILHYMQLRIFRVFIRSFLDSAPVDYLFFTCTYPRRIC